MRQNMGQITRQQRQSSQRGVGWLRLWIVAAGGLAVLFLAITIWKLPEPQSISHEIIYVSLTSDVQVEFDKAEALRDAPFAIRMSNGHVVNVQEKLNAESRRSNYPWLQMYEEVLQKKLLNDRLHFGAKMIALWLASVSLIYAMGLGVAWIRSGFSGGS